jgi:hypothetical protein
MDPIFIHDSACTLMVLMSPTDTMRSMLESLAQLSAQLADYIRAVIHQQNSILLQKHRNAYQQDISKLLSDYPWIMNSSMREVIQSIADDMKKQMVLIQQAHQRFQSQHAHRIPQEFAPIYDIRVYPDLSNGRWPRCETNTKVMQTTAYFHHHVAHPVFPQSDGIFDDPTPFDAADDMFGHYPTLGHTAIVDFLLGCQLFAFRLLDRPRVLHTWQDISQEAKIVDQFTPIGQGIRRRIGNRLIMHAALIGVAQEQHHQGSMQQEHVFYRMALFLAAITAALFMRVLRARSGALGAIVKKGAASTSVLRSAKRSRRSARPREGRSPSEAKAVRRAGSRT